MNRRGPDGCTRLAFTVERALAARFIAAVPLGERSKLIGVLIEEHLEQVAAAANELAAAAQGRDGRERAIAEVLAMPIDLQVVIWPGVLRALDRMVERAIRSALTHFEKYPTSGSDHLAAWRGWAEEWLAGTDRSAESADVARRQGTLFGYQIEVRKAAIASAAAAFRAAQAVETRYMAAWCCDACLDVARACGGETAMQLEANAQDSEIRSEIDDLLADREV